MTYPLTREALERYDEHAERTHKLLDDAVTNEDVAFWSHVCLMRADYVRQAFLADTADRNRWSQVRVVQVEEIRQIVNAQAAAFDGYLAVGEACA